MKNSKNTLSFQQGPVTDDPTLPVPYVTNVDDGFVTQGDIDNGIQCEIPRYSDAALGDKVILYWGENYTISRLIKDPEDNLPWIIDIVQDTPQEQTLADGPYEVHYSVEDQAHNLAISESVNFEITSHLNPGSLPAPVIPDTQDDNTINEDEAKLDVIVQTGYNAITTGDSIVLRLQGFDSETDFMKEDYTATYTVQDADVPNKYAVFTVPYATFQAIGEFAYANAWFIVTPAAGGTTKSSATKKFYVDVVRAH